MSKYGKVIVGETYNKWKVIEYSGEKIGDSRDTYLCECTCPFHTRKVQRGIHIVGGMSKSCKHCSRLNDITGETFDYLTVKGLDVERTLDSINNDKRRRTYWFVDCKCGNSISVREDTLYSKYFRSCGCHRKEITDLTGMRVGKLKVVSFDKKILYKAKENLTTYLFWICDCDCGKRISVRQSNLLSGNSLSCGCKSDSNSEAETKHILDNWGIEYFTEYRFDDCKHKNTLPFDFYIPDKKICIELDGEDHYEPIKRADWSEEETLSRFEARKQKDKIKTEYCKSHKIKLIRIPYWDFDDIEYILFDKLVKYKVIEEIKAS